MPVYKVVTIKFFFAEARRIVCDNCMQPFSYVSGGTIPAKASGIPLLSDSEKMARAAYDVGLEYFKISLQVKDHGSAICPRCKCYQKWMVHNSRVSWMLSLVAIFGLLFPLLSIAAKETMGWFISIDEMNLLVVSSLAGVPCGLGIGFFLSHKRGPHEHKIPVNSMTDEEFRQHLNRCRDENADPILEWWTSLGNRRKPEQIPFSIGLLDLTGSPVFPEEISTEFILHAKRTF